MHNIKQLLIITVLATSLSSFAAAEHDSAIKGEYADVPCNIMMGHEVLDMLQEDFHAWFRKFGKKETLENLGQADRKFAQEMFIKLRILEETHSYGLLTEDAEVKSDFPIDFTDALIASDELKESLHPDACERERVAESAATQSPDSLN
jgi:hypothetical protein